MTGQGPTWDDIDAALGLSEAGERSPEMVGYFREAGFDETEARRGAELMESSVHYFGFVDVATALAGGYQFGGGSMPISPIQRERIVAVGRKIAEAEASKAPPSRPSAKSGGKPIAESADRRPVAPEDSTLGPGGRAFVKQLIEAGLIRKRGTGVTGS